MRASWRSPDPCVTTNNQPAATPYRASHAVYVLEGAEDTFDAAWHGARCSARPALSLRAFDSEGMMLAADVVEGHGDRGADRAAAWQAQ